MSSEIIVALLAFAGTLSGVIGTVYAASKKTTYQLQRLEEKVDKLEAKVDKHNHFYERVAVIENKDNIFDKHLERHDKEIEKLRACLNKMFEKGV